MISVIIPTFNRPEQTLAAVRTVLAQTIDGFELLVVDDGSSSDMSAVKELVESSEHNYYTKAHQGVSSARNFGVVKSTGELLSFLDSDDRWLPDKLEQQLKFCEKNPHYKISQCREIWHRDGKFVNPRKKHALPNGEAFKQSLEICCVSASSVMIERSLFEQLGGFDERMKVCEDYDLWLRAAVSHQIGLVDHALVEKFGGHADQLSKSVEAMDRFRVFSILKLLSETRLSEIQYQAAREAVGKKAKVLANGAKKRGNEVRADLYAEVSAWAGGDGESGELEQLVGLSS